MFDEPACVLWAVPAKCDCKVVPGLISKGLSGPSAVGARSAVVYQRGLGEDQTRVFSSGAVVMRGVGDLVVYGLVSPASHGALY